MKKKLLFAVALLFFFAATLYTEREASAIPAFARQTGMACNTCHFQHFPTLNSFGRAFKAGGYTMIGGQSLVEGDFLSLPSVLNASLVTKVRYQKRNGSSETGSAGELNKGQVQFPDEAALLIGGRAGEHIGLLLEASLKDGDSRFTSYKMPIVFDAADTKINFIPFSTDAAGAAYGLELLNTGSLRMQRTLEHRTQISAQQYIGTDGAATGFTLAAVHNLGFANYTIYYPEHGDAAVGPYLNYGRVALTPTLAGWDLGIGFQVWSGTSKTGPGSAATRTKRDAWAVDAQAQGTVADLPLGVYITYASADKSKTGEEPNSLNTSVNKDKTAWTITGELGVLPNKLVVAAAYRGGNNGDPNNNGLDSDNATTLGLVYNPVQNLQVQLNNSWLSGDVPNTSSGKILTTLMLFAAF